ncbi:MAG TPA: Tim44 domain-containing protein [Syntrophorhabdaceae bacterium]|nr:Tim44 domain-containing protein [Syntrophorhabdaceae bacterium]
MKRNVKSLLKSMTIILVLFFICYITSETLAHARAGGGRSIGSRGFSSGRSYQRTTPYQTHKPYQGQQQTQPGYAQPQVQQPSFGRSLLYGIGGGILGGMIGSMLFGRSGYAGTGSYGGFGFGDLIILLLLVGIVYYVVKRIRARKQALEGAGYSNYSYTEPAYDTAYSGHTEQESPVFSGLKHITQTDPLFDEARFKETAQDIFFKIQGAWTRRDLKGVRDLLTPQMYNIFQDEINKLIANKQINRLENIAIREVDIVDAVQDQGEEYITVKFHANLLDYTVDEKDGRIISGSDTEPVKFLEYWTFYRKTGDARWMLSGITQENDY